MGSRLRAAQEAEFLLQVGVQLLQEQRSRSCGHGRSDCPLLCTEGDGRWCLVERLSGPGFQLDTLLSSVERSTGTTSLQLSRYTLTESLIEIALAGSLPPFCF